MAKLTERLGQNPDPAKLPVGKHSDGDGLSLMVVDGADGKRGRWIAKIKTAGKWTERGLGPAGPGGIPVKAARREVARLKFEAEQHADVAVEAAPLRSVPTFAQMADELLNEYVSTLKNPKHRKQWAYTLMTLCRPLCPLHVDKIEVDDVLGVLRPLWRSTPETGKRTRSRIERVLSRAEVLGFRPRGNNPAQWKGFLSEILPARGRLVVGHAAMPWKDLPEFMKRLRGARTRSVSSWCLEWVIMTTCRSGEARGMTWREVSDPSTWIVPAERMKAAREHVVPVVFDAQEILSPWRNFGEPNPDDFVFAGMRRGTCLSDMAISMVLRRMGVPFTVHGFRSSFRDWVFDNQVAPREIAELQLAHAIGNKTEAAYLRSRGVELRRELLIKWAEFLRTGKV